MKPLCCLLFVFFLAFKAYSQNCKALDSKTFFKSITFGKPVPADLISCAKKNKTELLRIEYDSLSKACKKKYADVFTFLSLQFSFSQVMVNNKGGIVSVDLYSFFEDSRHGDSTNYTPPPNFTRLYNKLVSLYGKPGTVSEASKTDSLFIKELGMPRVVDWDCENINLRLRVNYGSHKKDLNVIEVQIANRNFDQPEVVELLQ